MDEDTEGSAAGAHRDGPRRQAPLTAHRLDHLFHAAAALLTSTDRWVQRRVERVTVDLHAVRHEIGLDCFFERSAPRSLDFPGVGNGERVVPLAFLPSETYVELSIHDGTGTSVALLPGRLTRRFCDWLTGSVDEDVTGASPLDGPQRLAVRALLENHRLVLVAIPGDVERTNIKLSYTEVVPWTESRQTWHEPANVQRAANDMSAALSRTQLPRPLRWVARGLTARVLPTSDGRAQKWAGRMTRTRGPGPAWLRTILRPVRLMRGFQHRLVMRVVTPVYLVDFRVAPVLPCRSYRLEIVVPVGVVLANVEYDDLLNSQRLRRAEVEVLADRFWHERFRSTSSNEGLTSSDREVVAAELPTDQTTIRAKVTVGQSGVAHIMAMATTANAVSVAGACIFFDRILSDAQSGIAVLLFLPAALSFVAARPGEHRFVSFVLSQLRRLTTYSGVAVLVTAWIVVLKSYGGLEAKGSGGGPIESGPLTIAARWFLPSFTGLIAGAAWCCYLALAYLAERSPQKAQSRTGSQSRAADTSLASFDS